jgi:hypothetical protein
MWPGNTGVDFVVINVNCCELVALQKTKDKCYPRIHSHNNNRLFFIKELILLL